MPNAPLKQVKNGLIDYLVMDYLAEVTMSIMQKQRMKNPNYGYAHDVINVIEHILPDIAERGIKFVTNAGGVNPESCKDAIVALIEDLGFENITVAVINGDDILPQIDELINSGHHLKYRYRCRHKKRKGPLVER
ncbi:MAG: acyclic terpene utilization AtuA family protein [Balneolaceae bacterium]|nr:acyclic terpene utilization AtuA family protein [Balneolaceae bacterium]